MISSRKTGIYRLAAALLIMICTAVIAGLDTTQTAAAETDVSAPADYTYTVTKAGDAVITGYTGSSTELQIPGQLGGYKVTGISDEAFYGMKKIEKAVVPEGVKAIGKSVFMNCLRLREVKLPQSLTAIGESAFENCRTLEKIALPGRVTAVEAGTFRTCRSLVSFRAYGPLERIGDNAFNGCGSLSEVLPGDSLEYIGAHAFYDCTSLESINLPEGLATLEWDAFCRCSSLTEITLPDSAVNIKDSVFSGCKSLRSAKLSSRIERIPAYFFSGCTSLEEITIPETVKTIGSYAFDECSSLDEVTLPEGLTELGFGCFYECTGLGDMKVPDNVETMENYVFSKCRALKSVSLPDDLVSIGMGVFENCAPDLVICCSCGSEGEAYARANGISIGGNDYQRNVEKASLASAGRKTQVCEVCGEVIYDKEIPEISRAELSETTYICDGKAKTPSVTICDSSGRRLVEGSDYTVKYPAGRKNCGTYTVKVSFRGNYTGEKSLKFTIKAKLKKPSAKAAKTGKRSVRISWSKVSGATGYRVYVREPGSSRYKMRITRKANVKAVVHKGLKKGRKYSYKVRAYRTAGGKTVYSPYSKVRTVKVR